MKAEVRRTLRTGDTIIAKNNDFHGMLGVVIDETYKTKCPEYAHTLFVVRYENGTQRYCTAYNCDKVVTDDEGFMRVLK